MKQKGFTLIELLVVVAIIGILAAVGVVAYNGYTGAAKINAVKTNFKMAEKKLTEAFTMCKSGLDFFLVRWAKLPKWTYQWRYLGLGSIW